MILRQLEYFVALARERHFGRAAESCNVSQPALSMAIRKLEAELGMELVHRGRTVRLTDAGLALVQRAQTTVGSAQDLVAEASGLRGRLTATLRLGVIPTTAVTAATIVAPLQHEHPAVRVEIRTRSTARILSGLRERELDAGLIYVDDPPTGLAVDPLYRERFVLLSASDGGEASPARWDQLAGRPLCLLTEEMQHRQIVDGALRSAGVELARPAVEADSFTVLLQLVLAGYATVVGHPWLAGRTLPAGVRARPLVAPAVAPRVGLVTAGGTLDAPVARALRAALSGIDVQARVGPDPG